MRLAILTSHPIQYYAPLFREISRSVELKVFFAHRATAAQQATAGFGKEFDWDVDLVGGYEHEFLQNVAERPGTDHFGGCDTPEVEAKIVGGNFDALLVTGWHLKSYWQGIWSAQWQGLPVMVRGDSHLETPRSIAKRSIKALAYPALLRAFHAALFVGKRNLAYFRHYRYPEDRLFFSPHCVDNEFFAKRATEAARAAVRDRFGVPAGCPLALFAGKLVPFKRPLDVVRAAAGVRAQGMDLHVLVAGSGELQREMEVEAKSSQVPVHFLGFRNQSEMPAAYAAADVLVSPSDGRESWGMVANEAIASGRPIIVSDAVGCAPDLAGDHDAGRTFLLGDISGLTTRMLEVIGNPPLMLKMRDRSVQYSLEAAAKGVTSALERVRVSKRSSTNSDADTFRSERAASLLRSDNADE